MSDERHAVICRPTEGYASPVAGSTREHCEICATEVWLSPASRAAGGGEPLVLCIECAPGVMATEQQVIVLQPTAEQLDELRTKRAQQS